MPDGYLVQHVHRQSVPEVKPRWAVASGNIVGICKRLSFDAEPTRGTFVNGLRVGVSDLIGQTVAIPVPRQNDDQPLNQQLANSAVTLLKREAQLLSEFWRGTGSRVTTSTSTRTEFDGT